MLDRRRTTFLDRLGRHVAAQPPQLRFGLALAGFVLFVGLSSLAFVAVAGWLGRALPEIASPGAMRAPGARGGIETFDNRLVRVTDIAKGCFLDVGLSKDHFLTRYDDDQTVGSRVFRFRYWDVWIPETFDILELLAAMRSHPGIRNENVTFEFQEGKYDEKTFTIEVFVDGINTHRMWFTNATRELPQGARVLLAHVPASATTIDIGAIPEISYEGPPRVGIIIDDIGVREAIDRLFFQLPVQVTFSVLPFGPSSVETAELAHRRGHEVMLHQPMEPLDTANHDPGFGKLTLSMTTQQVRAVVERNLAAVPHVKGMNNHMGSAFTRNASRVQAAILPLKKRGLFFVDSVTIGDSVAYQVAKRNGVPSVARNLFLDYKPDLETIRRQVDLLGRIATAQGSAIAIGHPFQNTYLALKEGIPKLLAQGIEVVPVAELVK